MGSQPACTEKGHDHRAQMGTPCPGAGVLRDMTAGKVECECGSRLWASAQVGSTLGWTPPHPIPPCGTLSGFGALPCAQDRGHLGLCRDKDGTKAWPGTRCDSRKVEGKRSWRCRKVPHGRDEMHSSGPGGGRRW